MAVESLRERPIPATAKGFGVIAAGRPVNAAAVAERRLPALGGEFTKPLLVLRDSAIEHNIAAMAHWCARAGVLLAPHVKTAMAPQLAARQLAAGAWAVTVATIGQAQVFRAFGADRILVANELTDQAAIGWLAAELSADPSWECYAYADSLEGVRLLDRELRAAGTTRPLPVLVELGFPGGRTGCRSVADGLAVAAAVQAAGVLTLAGAAGYEGGLGHDTAPATLAAVAAFCADLRSLALRLPGEPPGLSSPSRQLPGQPPGAERAWIVSAGGSAYFDVVASELTAGRGDDSALTVVLRSGCYLAHDHGFYARLSPDARRGGPALLPAMELWAPVLSRPEPGLAILCAGRRDASFDQDLPVPLRVRGLAGGEQPAADMTVTRLDDQHAYLSVPDTAGIGPADLVCLGISHPCGTFDRWRAIPLVDDDYRVIDVIHTFF